MEGQLGLGVDDLPAARHELGLVEEARLAEQQAGVARRQRRLQEGDAGPRQVRHDVLFRRVQRHQHRVGLQHDLVAVQVPVRRNAPSPLIHWVGHTALDGRNLFGNLRPRCLERFRPSATDGAGVAARRL